MTDRRPLSLFLAGLCAAGLALCLLFRTDYFAGIALTLGRWPLVAALAVLAFRLRHRALPFALCLTLASVAVGQWLWLGTARAEPAKPAEAPRTLHVVTHNVLFQGASMPDSLRMLEAQHADLVALQEVTPKWEAALDRALLGTLPHKLARAHVGTHGFAVYSRFPLREGAWLNNLRGRPIAQCFTVELPGQHLPVCNVHLASPSEALSKKGAARFAALEANARTRAAQWAQVEAQLAGSQTHLVLGDLNTLEVEPLYTDITSNWVDAYRNTNTAPGATWPNHVRALRPFARIDYVLTAGDITPRDAGVPGESGSDHLAVRADLEVSPAQ